MTKTFLLGMGAQKAGTTWIHKYLKEHPECRMGPIKEQAVFTSHFKVGTNKKRTLAKIEKLQEELAKYHHRISQQIAAPARDRALLNLTDNLAAELDPKYYLSYANRVFGADPATRLTGDITPLYSTLKADHLAAIKDLLEGAGYAVKVVFLMRDPIERCYSALRMDHFRDGAVARKGTKGPHVRFAQNALQDWNQGRTRYECIIPEIEKTFAPQDVFIDLYETFFTEEKIQALCDFLGISYVAADLQARVNASARQEEPSDDQLAKVRGFYDATYRYAAQSQGAEVISAAWPHYDRAF